MQCMHLTHSLWHNHWCPRALYTIQSQWCLHNPLIVRNVSTALVLLSMTLQHACGGSQFPTTACHRGGALISPRSHISQCSPTSHVSVALSRLVNRLNLSCCSVLTSSVPVFHYEEAFASSLCYVILSVIVRLFTIHRFQSLLFY